VEAKPQVGTTKPVIVKRPTASRPTSDQICSAPVQPKKQKRGAGIQDMEKYRSAASGG
jgi:hypothetical protein